VFKDPEAYMFLTCGDWDLRTMLPLQHAFSASEDSSLLPMDPIFQRWMNIKTAFKKHYQKSHPKGMKSMLNQLKLGLEGRHHSGLDDCRNISRIVRKMQEDGWEPADAPRSTL
jgi:ERI1 exoribonuclease 3